MAVARVQAVGNAGTTVASLSIGAGQGWGTPTSGNTIVVSGNSDATVTGPTGFSPGSSVVDGNGAYFFYKVSNGTESTITVTPSSSANTCMTATEYSGLTGTPFDVSNSSTIAGSSGTTTTSTSVTPTAAGDLIVTVAALHGYSGAAPTGVTWTNSFTNVLSPSSGSGVATHVTTFYADLIVAGASGTPVATSASWTNAASDRQELVMAFLAGAGTVNADAAPTITATISPAAASTKPVDSTITATAGITPTALATKPVDAALTATVAATPTAALTKPVDSSLTIAAGITPAASLVKPAQATLAAAVSIIAVASVGSSAVPGSLLPSSAAGTATSTSTSGRITSTSTSGQATSTTVGGGL